MYNKTKQKIKQKKTGVQNACATQAILGILLNRSEIKLGPELENFKEITKDLDPVMKGIAIGENDHIRKVHNSFKTQEPFESDERMATPKDDVNIIIIIIIIIINSSSSSI